MIRVTNVYKYLPHYSNGATAEFVEGTIFRTIIRLQEISVKTSAKITEHTLQNNKFTFEEKRDETL